MKKICLYLIILFVVSFSLYAEKLTFHTGESFGVSNTDYFFPVDISFTATKCTVTSIKKIENDLWCLTLTAQKSVNTNAPVIFEYFVRKNDVIKMRRLDNPMTEIQIRVISINWNEITIEME